MLTDLQNYPYSTDTFIYFIANMWGSKQHIYQFALFSLTASGSPFAVALMVSQPDSIRKILQAYSKTAFLNFIQLCEKCYKNVAFRWV